jgi:hypothetical protein
MFDEVIGSAIRERDDKIAKQSADRDAEDQKHRDAMAPIREAFEEIVRTRKPKTVDHEPLSLEEGECYSSRSIVGFRIRPQGGRESYYIRAEWKPEISCGARCSNAFYRVVMNKTKDGNSVSLELAEESFVDWRDAYRRTLEHLAPHIAYCEGKESA